MEKQFVTYNIALKLKELGFNEECFGWWNHINGNAASLYEYKISNSKLIELNTFPKNCAAPLHQQAIDWLREEHGIHIELDFGLGWGYGFIPVGTEFIFNWNHFEDGHDWSYNDAREHAILKALELISQIKVNTDELKKHLK